VLRLTLLLFTLATSNISPSNTFVFLSCVWFDGRCAEICVKTYAFVFVRTNEACFCTLHLDTVGDQTDDLPHSHHYITEVGNFIYSLPALYYIT
jgi:hypothetical protein